MWGTSAACYHSVPLSNPPALIGVGRLRHTPPAAVGEAGRRGAPGTLTLGAFLLATPEVTGAPEFLLSWDGFLLSMIWDWPSK